MSLRQKIRKYYKVTKRFNNKKHRRKRRIITIGIIGDWNVGKTKIIKTLMGVEDEGIDIFVEKLNVQFQGDEFFLQCWDTDGIEQFNLDYSKYHKKCQIMLCCFNLYNSKSFENLINNWMNQVINCCKEDQTNTIFILIGTKANNESKLPDGKKIDINLILNYASQNNFSYLETDAKSLHNIPVLINYIYHICKYVLYR